MKEDTVWSLVASAVASAQLLILASVASHIPHCTATDFAVVWLCGCLVFHTGIDMLRLGAYYVAFADPDKRLKSMLVRGFRGMSHTRLGSWIFNVNRLLCAVVLFRLEHRWLMPVSVLMVFGVLMQGWLDAILAYMTATDPEFKARLDRRE